MSAAARGIALESFDNDGVDMIDQVMEIHASKNVSNNNCIAYHFASYLHGHGKTEGILADFGYNIILVSNRGTPVLTQFKNVLANHCNCDFEISIQTISNQAVVDDEREIHNICVHSAHHEKIIGKSFVVRNMIFYHISMDEVFSSLRKDLTDRRAFWTLNTKAMCRMRKAILQNFTYCPALIYPTDFHHDISFWVHNRNETAKHDVTTERLATLVSLIADEAFYCIDLLEEYVKDGKKSMLYRITYRSLHYVLSRQQCSKLQLDVRRHIERFFNVQSR